MPLLARTAELFRHVSVEKGSQYRTILEVFAAAKRQFRLQLRPEELLAEGDWPGGAAPGAEELAAALAQLVEWGNLEAQPDMVRVTNLLDYYRAKYLYRLSQEGEAIEAAFDRFAEAMARRAELQTVALEDIGHRLQALQTLLEVDDADVAKLHAVLGDLVRVFEGLAENAQSFMAGVARSIELQRADAVAVAAYKSRLIDYLQRFVGDLVLRSEPIAQHLVDLTPRMDAVLLAVAGREARDAAPGDAAQQADEQGRRWRAWRERWKGLRGWFLPTANEPPQAQLLRARATSAIPQLLAAIAGLNERRSGRSDRSADFRLLAGWFAACDDDAAAHQLARAAFALNPARHLATHADAGELPPSASWTESPPMPIHPRLRQLGEAVARGPQARIQHRDAERARLAFQLEDESRQFEAARARLATGRPTRLSELGVLDEVTFRLFLGVIGEALGEQASPDVPVERASADGLFVLRLEPLGPDTEARIRTPSGCFGGRDHWLTVTSAS